MPEPVMLAAVRAAKERRPALADEVVIPAYEVWDKVAEHLAQWPTEPFLLPDGNLFTPSPRFETT